MSSEQEIENGDWPSHDKLPYEPPVPCKTCGEPHTFLQPGYVKPDILVTPEPGAILSLPVSQELEVLKQILETMQENNKLLKNLIDVRDNPNQQTPGLFIHESEATCPNCDSIAVDLFKKDCGARMYKCKACEFMWANSEADVLAFSEGIEI